MPKAVENTPEVIVSDGAIEGQIRPRARPESQPIAQSPKVSQGAVAGLGATIASLGSPVEPGLWLKTPLVQVQGAGKVSYRGKDIAVTLIPLVGPRTAGSRMSLAAFQALGIALTELPEVSVSG